MLAAAGVTAALLASATPLASATEHHRGAGRHATQPGAAHDGLGITPGTIKHVWLIILENKSYDASFTGLNNNTYLWKSLPGQGVLLKHYYGTGHFSLDN